jgi:hypothetical protein
MQCLRLPTLALGCLEHQPFQTAVQNPAYPTQYGQRTGCHPYNKSKPMCCSKIANTTAALLSGTLLKPVSARASMVRHATKQQNTAAGSVVSIDQSPAVHCPCSSHESFSCTLQRAHTHCMSHVFHATCSGQPAAASRHTPSQLHATTQVHLRAKHTSSTAMTAAAAPCSPISPHCPHKSCVAHTRHTSNFDALVTLR